MLINLVENVFIYQPETRRWKHNGQHRYWEYLNYPLQTMHHSFHRHSFTFIVIDNKAFNFADIFRNMWRRGKDLNLLWKMYVNISRSLLIQYCSVRHAMEAVN